jgi:hypothetical protein
VVKVPDNLGIKHLLQQESNNNNNKLQRQRQHLLVGSNRGPFGLVSPTSMVGSQSEVRAAVNDGVKTAKPAKAPKERAGSGQTKRWTWKKPGDKVSHSTVSSTNGDIGLSHLTQPLLPDPSLQ